MGKFSGVLLAVDYDGTIRPFGGAGISPANRRAAEYFMAEGGRFTLCTGRDQMSYYSIRDIIPVNAPLILNNGAQIFDSTQDESLYESFLPFTCREDFRRLLEHFPRVGMEVLRGGDLRVCRVTEEVRYHLSKMNAPVREAPMEKLMFPWTKVALLAPGVKEWDITHSRPVQEWLNENYPGKYGSALSGGVLDVTAPEVDKGTGLTKLAELCDIAPEHIYCGGDGWNDLAMLGRAREFFVPETAIEPLRAAEVTVLGGVDGFLEELVGHLDKLYS